MRRRISLFALLFALSHLCHAAFEEAQTDARVYGMGGAGISLADLPQSGLANPALPALCEEQSVGTGWSLPFALKDLATAAVCGSYQKDRWGLGAALLTTGNQLYRESTGRASLGFRFCDNMAAGLALDGQHLGIERYGSATAVGLSAGLLGSPLDNLTLAVCAGNVNRPLIGNTGQEVDQTLSCGASYRPLQQFTLAFQLQAQRGWPAQLRFGQEYRWRDLLFLRAGFADRPNAVSLGFGVAWHRFRLDYAARTHPVLGLSHCLSLQYETQRIIRVEPARSIVDRSKQQPEKLDLNTATQAEQLLLPGIGETRAREILALRDSLRTFGSLNDLLAIKGLTYEKLEELQPYVAQELKRVEVAVELVDINTATADQLATLPGIGAATAQDIIAYRAAHGPFASPEDLMNVKGIGRVKFEKLKDLVAAGH